MQHVPPPSEIGEFWEWLDKKKKNKTQTNKKNHNKFKM